MGLDWRMGSRVLNAKMGGEWDKSERMSKGGGGWDKGERMRKGGENGIRGR